MKIQFKLSLILLFVSLISIAPISFVYYNRSQEIITTKTFEVCENLAINLSTVAREELLMNSAYEGTLGVINTLKRGKDSSLVSVFVLNKYGINMADLNKVRIGQRLSESELEYFKTLEEPNISEVTSENLDIMRFEFPVFLEQNDSNSIKLGFVVFEFDREKLYSGLNQFKRNIFFLSLGCTVLIVILSLFLSRAFTKDIKALSEKVRLIGEGDLDTKITISSQDEIGDLARNFNEMAEKLKLADEHKEALLESYGKFVPMEFLRFLQKDSILDISLGDQIDLEMTILFSDIRSFTTISEKMSAEQTFKFVNSYLDVMGPQVQKNKGFIDKFIGDAIMALFPEPSFAIDASIDMLEELYMFNKKQMEKGIKKTSIGIGIHSGKLILGIVGSQLRVQGTVISDAVNLTSRLEGLTKYYGATCIISEECFLQIRDQSKYLYRMIDKVVVKGKAKPVTIYEILNGNSERIINLKLQTRSIFENALSELQNQNFSEASQLFSIILEKDPNDIACIRHLEKSLYYLEHGVPPDWSGESYMTEK